MLDYINNNPWLNVVFLILTIASMLLSLVLYIKSKKKRIPCYSIVSNNLVRESIYKYNKIEIHFEKEKVNSLTVSKIAIWNAGTETINYSDVASSKPIHIKTTSAATILDAELLYVKNPANNFDVNYDKNSNVINISFEYFDYGEGIVLQIFHDGIGNTDLIVSGNIKSSGEFKLIKSPSPLIFWSGLFANTFLFKYRKFLRIWMGISFISVPIFVGTFLFFVVGFKNSISSFASFLVSILIIMIPYWGYGLYLLKPRIPKGFVDFEKDK